MAECAEQAELSAVERAWRAFAVAYAGALPLHCGPPTGGDVGVSKLCTGILHAIPYSASPINRGRLLSNLGGMSGGAVTRGVRWLVKIGVLVARDRRLFFDPTRAVGMLETLHEDAHAPCSTACAADPSRFVCSGECGLAELDSLAFMRLYAAAAGGAVRCEACAAPMVQADEGATASSFAHAVALWLAMRPVYARLRAAQALGPHSTAPAD